MSTTTTRISKRAAHLLRHVAAETGDGHAEIVDRALIEWAQDHAPDAYEHWLRLRQRQAASRSSDQVDTD